MTQPSVQRILVTGFEPFGGSKQNPSEQVARTLDGERIGAAEICAAILPVDTDRGPRMLLALLEDLRPDAVICLGEAAGRSVVSIEQHAVNMLNFNIPDNAGKQVFNQPVIEDGPDTYNATLPVHKMIEAVRAAGVPAERSMSAGTFLCNQVLYEMLHHLCLNGQNTPAGFIHLPSLPEQVAESGRSRPSMDRETALRGIRAALNTLVEAA